MFLSCFLLLFNALLFPNFHILQFRFSGFDFLQVKTCLFKENPTYGRVISEFQSLFLIISEAWIPGTAFKKVAGPYETGKREERRNGLRLARDTPCKSKSDRTETNKQLYVIN